MTESTVRCRRDKPHIVLGTYTRVWVCINLHECYSTLPKKMVHYTQMWLYDHNAKEGRYGSK